LVSIVLIFANLFEAERGMSIKSKLTHISSSAIIAITS